MHGNSIGRGPVLFIEASLSESHISELLFVSVLVSIHIVSYFELCAW